MKSKSSATGALVALALCGGALAAEDLPSRVEASKGAIMAFAGSLKAELKAAMKSGGAVKAIAVCNEKAPTIADEQSARHGLTIRRTSLRPRNGENVPDAWERSVLEDFEQRRAAGDDPAALIRYEVVEADGLREFRFMKAIPTAEVCLACHGNDIAPDVTARLDALYPDDRARGFAVGDLRGAFTVRQPM